jgi:hypothetical protein
VQVLFIEQSSGSIFHTRGSADRTWQPASLQQNGIRGQWIRGTLLARKDGAAVFGYVYDAGSDGGSGMNRFGTVFLGKR